MKQKIKNFFSILWFYLTFPYLWLSTRKVQKMLYHAAAQWKANFDKTADAVIQKALETIKNYQVNEK